VRDRLPWTVTLVCGASGVGKSHLARALADRYGVPLGEADDIVTALKAVTSAEQQPLLHRWETDPQVRTWRPEQIAELHLEVAGALRPAYEAVIADHVECGAPAVFEGDYLLPELAGGQGGPGGLVRAVLLDEPDAEQIAANYLRREPGTQQAGRARVSAMIGAGLARRARRLGIPVVPARPWGGSVDRVTEALVKQRTVMDDRNLTDGP